MSHFALLVVTKEEPISRVLEAALKPFEEVPTCQAFIFEIDETQEMEKRFATSLDAVVVEKDGKIYSKYDDRYWRSPSKEEREIYGNLLWGRSIKINGEDVPVSQGKIFTTPAGSKLDEANPKAYMDFKVYLERCGYDRIGGVSDHRYFYAVDENEEVVAVRSYWNINGKWDWWTMGGRYSGRLKEKGLDRYVDCCQKKNLDLEGMKQKKIYERKDMLKEILEKTGFLDYQILQLAISELKQAKEEHARNTESNFQFFLSSKKELFPLAHKLIENTDYYNFYSLPVEQDLNKWIENTFFLSAFAFLKDFQWIEKGQMGWFGLCSNEDYEWEKKFVDLFDSVDDESWLSIVDCHI